jgi:hypothetical protein
MKGTSGLHPEKSVDNASPLVDPDSVHTKKSTRKPTVGKPKPLDMSGCILLSPDSMMKIDGQSMRSVYIEMGKESVFKGLERFLRTKPTKASPTLRKSMKALFDEMPPSDFKSLMLSALDGDTNAGLQIEKMGLWRAFRQAFPANLNDAYVVWIEHFVEIEYASVEVDALLRDAAYSRAADSVKGNPLLGLYFSEPALQRLAAATTVVDALVPRCAGMFEFLLAQVARIEVHLRRQEATDSILVGFDDLLMTHQNQTCNPGRELLRWMRSVLRAKTLNELFEMGKVSKDRPAVLDESTLKRWASGREFPREEKFRRYIQTVLEKCDPVEMDAIARRVRTRYWVARRLHKLLELVRLVLQNEHNHPGDKNTISVLLGSDSADDWVQCRYAFWKAHWENIGFEERSNTLS